MIHNIKARKRDPPADRALEMMKDDIEMIKLQTEIGTEQEIEAETKLETKTEIEIETAKEIEAETETGIEVEKEEEIEIEIEIDTDIETETETIENAIVQETNQTQEKIDKGLQVFQKAREGMMIDKVDVDLEVQQLIDAEEMTLVIVTTKVKRILFVKTKGK